MKRKATILSAVCFLASLGLVVAATVGLGTEPGRPAVASDGYTISFTKESNILTGGSGNQSVLTTLGNPVSFSYDGYFTSVGAWGFINADGHIENTTALSGLTNLSVTYGAINGNLAISYGWWDASSSSIVYEMTDGLITPDSLSFDFGQYSPSFFKITASDITQIISITVKYSCKATVDPTSYLSMSLADGAYSVTSCNTSAPFAIIPSTYNGLPVTSIGEAAFRGRSSLRSVIIPSSVTSIGVNAFNSCFGLTSATIPSSVTSIGDSAFQFCTSLTSATIASSVTSTGINLFNGCTSLTSATVDSTASLGSSAFNGCTHLTSVTIASSSIGNASFNGCSSLTSVTIASSVTAIGMNSFSRCTSLTSIVIPSSVTRIWGVTFVGDTKLSVFCQASSKPSGWSSVWSQDTLSVTWGYVI